MTVGFSWREQRRETIDPELPWIGGKMDSELLIWTLFTFQEGGWMRLAVCTHSEADTYIPNCPHTLGIQQLGAQWQQTVLITDQ